MVAVPVLTATFEIVIADELYFYTLDSCFSDTMRPKETLVTVDLEPLADGVIEISFPKSGYIAVVASFT